MEVARDYQLSKAKLKVWVVYNGHSFKGYILDAYLERLLSETLMAL